MIFNETQPIYLQLLDMINSKIISHEWVANERIPSVRDLAVECELNAKTVVRVYDILQNNNIIYKQRGMGYYLSPNAYDNTITKTRENFISNELPKLFKKLEELSISFEELEKLYKLNSTK